MKGTAAAPGQINQYGVSLGDRTRRALLFCAPLMPMQPCPDCGGAGRFLTDSSENASVDYYRCDRCGAVWVLDRVDSGKPPRIVTPGRPTPDGDDTDERLARFTMFRFFRFD